MYFILIHKKTPKKQIKTKQKKNPTTPLPDILKWFFISVTLASSEIKKWEPHLIRKKQHNYYKCFWVFKLVSQSQIRWFFSMQWHKLLDAFAFRLFLPKRKPKSSVGLGGCISDVHSELSITACLVWSYFWKDEV